MSQWINSHHCLVDLSELAALGLFAWIWSLRGSSSLSFSRVTGRLPLQLSSAGIQYIEFKFCLVIEGRVVPNAEMPVLVFSNDRVLEASTINVKREGVTIVAADADLSFFKNDADEVLVGSQMIVKFMPTKSNGSLDGSAFDVKLVNVLRLSAVRFRIYLAFQGLDRLQIANLKQFVANPG